MRTTLPSDWKARRFPKHRVTIPLELYYSAEDFDMLRRGVLPQQMEDKWFIYYWRDALHFHRSWTGNKIFRVDFKPESGRVRAYRAVVNQDPQQYTETSVRHHEATIASLIDILLLGRDRALPGAVDGEAGGPDLTGRIHILGRAAVGTGDKGAGGASAELLIHLLALKPHPEGGHYIETFRDAPGPDGRSRSTAIYFLLCRGERSHWHRVDAAESWHWYAGAPLLLQVAPAEGQPTTLVTLGPELLGGHRHQYVVPTHAWQAAETFGDWTLVGCVVAPGFDFAGFELAPPRWEP